MSQKQPRKSTIAWRMVKHMQLSQAEFFGSSGKDLSVPIFQQDWEEEYLETSFHPLEITFFCALSAVYYFLHFLVVACGSYRDGAGGDNIWLTMTWFPEVVSALSSSIIFALFNFSSTRKLCRKNYDWICGHTIALSYLATIGPCVMLEFRRSLFQYSEMPGVSWAINFQSFPPVRTCNDTDPTKTFRSPESHSTSIGCNNLILSGNIYSVYILHNLLPRIFRTSTVTAICVGLLTSLALIAALVVVGTRSEAEVICAVLFQFFVGLGAAYFCHVRKLISREQFVVAKGTKFATEQNRILLNTLIPQNVVEKLSCHKGFEILGNEIKDCCVMFCSLEPQHELQSASTADEFKLLDEVFSAFDFAVQKFGMFKYQHVSDWYIVACPRASCPFDVAEQLKEYPTSHTQTMVLLAGELKRIAKKFTSRAGKPLWLKVGLNCGPVAGAVIGSLRAFYCLYGDTINTSARMCKYGGDAVHCTPAFAARARAVCADFTCIVSRGAMEIKGKGEMETFDLSILDEKAEVIRAALGLEEAPVAAPARVRAVRKQSIFRRFSTTRGASNTSFLASTKKLSFSPIENLRIDDLTSDNRRWVEDPKHRIDRRLMVFHDAEFEACFVAGQALVHRQWLVAGLMLHIMAVGFQWGQVIYSEYNHDFVAGGGGGGAEAEALGKAERAVTGILSAHWAVSCLYCAGLVAAVWRNANWSRLASHHFLGLKLAHLAACAAATVLLPAAWEWTMAYTLEMLLINGWMGLFSLRGTAALAGVALGAYIAVVSAVVGLTYEAALRAIGFAVGVVWLARLSNFNQRVRWRLLRLFGSELRRLREILYDIIPQEVAEKMIRISAKPPSEPRRAVVLQLDICGFTVMSQTMKPMEVAELVHGLFWEFDSFVRERACLFKMDTVGDAYIVAGFLPANQDPAETCAVCRGLLEVALKILECIHRTGSRAGRRTRRRVRCRMGIAMDSVICGVLGRLQPRFHVFGPGIRAAEKLEQTGRPGAVHVSEAFLDAIDASAHASAAASSGGRSAGGGGVSSGGGVVRSGGGGGGARRLQDAPVPPSPTGGAAPGLAQRRSGGSGGSGGLCQLRVAVPGDRAFALGPARTWGAGMPAGWRVVESFEHHDCISPKKRPPSHFGSGDSAPAAQSSTGGGGGRGAASPNLRPPAAASPAAIRPHSASSQGASVAISRGRATAGGGGRLRSEPDLPDLECGLPSHLAAALASGGPSSTVSSVKRGGGPSAPPTPSAAVGLMLGRLLSLAAGAGAPSLSRVHSEPLPASGHSDAAGDGDAAAAAAAAASYGSGASAGSATAEYKVWRSYLLAPEDGGDGDDEDEVVGGASPAASAAATSCDENPQSAAGDEPGGAGGHEGDGGESDRGAPALSRRESLSEVFNRFNMV